MEPRHSLAVAIHSRKRLRLVPYGIDIDFGKLLADRGAGGRFDRFSVRVRSVSGGASVDVPFHLSEDFLVGSSGRVSWLIEDSSQPDYRILYDTDEHGAWPPPRYVGLVGDGDSIRYNDGELHPLHSGMAANPVAVDWDGDGRTDLLTPQIYSWTFGSPWFPIRFFRNEGTNAEPVFGEGVPLRVRRNGRLEIIAAGLDIGVLDWDGDGLLDLLAFPYGTPREVTIYRNTGEKDEIGLPVLEPSVTIPLEDKGHTTCVRAVDWFGDGRRSLLVGYIVTHEAQRNDPLWFPAAEADREAAQWPRWYYTSAIDLYLNDSRDPTEPRLRDPVTLVDTGGAPISWHTVSNFEMSDWDGDGAQELVVQDSAAEFHKGCVGLRLYRNAGTLAEPRFQDGGRIDGIQDRSSLSFHRVDTPAFKGILVNHGSASGKVRYYRWEGTDAKGLPVLRDQGFVRQRNAYVTPLSGYAQGSLCDWDGDGDWDLVSGCETGFVQRFENTGTRRRPVFAAPELLTLNGAALELLNGPFEDPGSFSEGNIGQTAPMYIDWDDDGTLDLVVTIGTHQLFFHNAGTSAHPVLTEPREISADGGEKVAKHRNKSAYLDWDGDGLIDVIGHDPEETGLYLFRRYRDQRTGELRLAPGVPLVHDDGSLVVPSSWHRYTKYFNAADWRGTRAYDVLVSTCDLILLLENAGTNAAPRFRKPVRLAVDDKPIVIGHHVSTPFPVDWDGSGRLDLFVSGESGLFHLFRRAWLDGDHHLITSTVSGA